MAPWERTLWSGRLLPLRLDGGARGSGRWAGARVTAQWRTLAICCLAVAGVNGCGWSAAFRSTLERDQSSAFRLVGSPEAPAKWTAQGLALKCLRPCQDTPGVPYGPCRGCRHHQAETPLISLGRALWPGAAALRCPKRLPIGRRSSMRVFCGLPRAPRSELSQPPGPPSVIVLQRNLCGQSRVLFPST